MPVVKTPCYLHQPSNEMHNLLLYNSSSQNDWYSKSTWYSGSR